MEAKAGLASGSGNMAQLGDFGDLVKATSAGLPLKAQVGEAEIRHRRQRDARRSPQQRVFRQIDDITRIDVTPAEGADDRTR